MKFCDRNLFLVCSLMTVLISLTRLRSAAIVQVHASQERPTFSIRQARHHINTVIISGSSKERPLQDDQGALFLTLRNKPTHSTTNTTNSMASSSPRPYEIMPPMTSGDKGVPTKSLLKDVERIFMFIHDERHLIAHELYQSVQRRLREWQLKHAKEAQKHKSKGPALFQSAAAIKAREQYEKKEEDANKAKELLEKQASVIDKLEVSCYTV